MRLIDADKIKYNSIGCWHPHCKEEDCNNCVHAVTRKYDVDTIPTIDAEPVRHGHWEDQLYIKTCSVCGKRRESRDSWWSYCPACGAKMDEVEK